MFGDSGSLDGNGNVVDADFELDFQSVMTLSANRMSSFDEDDDDDDDDDANDHRRRPGLEASNGTLDIDDDGGIPEDSDSDHESNGRAVNAMLLKRRQQIAADEDSALLADVSVEDAAALAMAKSLEKAAAQVGDVVHFFLFVRSCFSRLNRNVCSIVVLQLPKLACWLDKKSPSLLAGWQRRFVAVADNNIYYYSDEFSFPPNGPAVSAKVNRIPLIAVRAIIPRFNKVLQTDRPKERGCTGYMMSGILIVITTHRARKTNACSMSRLETPSMVTFAFTSFGLPLRWRETCGCKGSMTIEIT
jgi:hypothetical protein